MPPTRSAVVPGVRLERQLGDTSRLCQWTAGRLVVRSAPRATGAIAPERAGPERASRGGVSLAWPPTNSEGPRRRTSLSRRRRDRTRRRVGGLGSMPSPSDRSTPAGQNKSRHAVKKQTTAARPLGTIEPSRSEETKHGRPPAGQENLHGVEAKTEALHPEGGTRPRGSKGLLESVEAAALPG